MLDYVAPIFLIILIGTALKKLPPELFPKAPLSTLFPALEWLCFYVAFPALLFSRTAQMEISSATIYSLAGLVFIPIFAVLAMVLVGIRFYKSLPSPAKSSVVQGSIRPSTYFGLGVAGLALPEQSSTLVMLSLALALPITNVIAVIALSWWSGKTVSKTHIIKNILKNPTILGTLTGMLYNMTDWPLPAAVGNAMTILGDVALGLGLLCVGAGLELKMKGALPLAIVATNTAKMVILPIITYLLCLQFEIPMDVTVAVCFYAGLPAAPNAYIMARQLGGDARLMASLITSQTLLAMITVPMWLSFLDVSNLF